MSYPVKLVAVSGREQPVVLKIRRDGLWLYTEHGKEIQQLPYQHIVKWLPSKMRSRDPGPDECLDIQVETASGKKDLRMRCQSEPAVQGIIADIRQTVQAIMSELDPAKASKASPLKAGLAAAAKGPAAAAAADGGPSFDSFARRVSEDAAAAGSQSPARSDHMHAASDAADAAARSVVAGAAGLRASSPTQQQSFGRTAAQQQQQPESQQQQSSPVRQAGASSSSSFRQAQKQIQQQQQPESQQQPECGQQQQQEQQQHSYQQQQQQQHDTPHVTWGGQEVPYGGGGGGGYGSSSMFASPLHHSYSQFNTGRLSAVGPVARMLDSKEMELEVPGDGPTSFGGARRVSLGRLGLAAGAPMRRSTGELAEHLAAPADAQITFLEDMVLRLSHELSSRLAQDPAGFSAGGSQLDSSQGAAASLPPWMKDSRYLNPLLSAYDQRLTAVQAELAAKAEAVQDIKAKVRQLVDENEVLHDRLAQQASRLEARALDSCGGDMDAARLQERLELLEHENDLLVDQQGELDIEISRLAGQLAEREHQLAAVSELAAAGSARISELEHDLRAARKREGDTSSLKGKVKELSDRLREEAGRTSEALAAAELARTQASVLQQELAAAHAAARVVPGLQADLSKARAAAESSAGEVACLRSEAEGLRAALHAVEARLTEYQEKDTEVYLRIKEAMELAEEARLERDAARTETDSLAGQLAATQARLHEAARQLSGGGPDGGLSYKELKVKLAAAEDKLAAAAAQEEEQTAKLSELRLTVERLVRDKSSLKTELTALREEMELTAFTHGKTASMADRLADVERARDEALQKLDSQQRAAARADREWELEKQQLQADIQRLAKRVAAAEDAAAAATSAAAEAQQATAVAEGELSALRAGRGRIEAELRQQLAELRSARDAEVAALVQKLERALATCDKSVVDAEQMLGAKDSLLRRWKQEAQLIASKLEVALQQHQAELAECQAQVGALTQQLAAAHEQQELLQQELDATRLTCQEAELLLGEAESRAAQADASAAAQQDDIMQELRSLQTQLERSQLDKLRAERARDGVAAKLGRIMMAGSLSAAASPTGTAGEAADAAGCSGSPVGGGIAGAIGSCRVGGSAGLVGSGSPVRIGGAAGMAELHIKDQQ